VISLAAEVGPAKVLIEAGALDELQQLQHAHFSHHVRQAAIQAAMPSSSTLAELHNVTALHKNLQSLLMRQLGNLQCCNAELSGSQASVRLLQEMTLSSCSCWAEGMSHG
jgi:hypothetical protein